MHYLLIENHKKDYEFSGIFQIENKSEPESVRNDQLLLNPQLNHVCPDRYWNIRFWVAVFH